MRRKLRLILFACLVVTIGIIAIELILRATDPLGAYRYFVIDVERFYRAAIPDDTRGYVLPPGQYTFADWSATVNADNTRFTPATPTHATCTIAFIGDSITFGMGVNDGETWVNLLAREYADVRFVNAGVIGYNTAQVLAMIRAVPADGYFYTMFDNDADIPLDPMHDSIPPSALLVTWRLRFGGGYAEVEDWVSFDAAMREIKALANVVTVGFTNAPVALRTDVPTVARWTHKRSAMDGHANAVGNVEIAAAMRGRVGELVGRVCG